jgi:ribosomal protein S11
MAKNRWCLAWWTGGFGSIESTRRKPFTAANTVAASELRIDTAKVGMSAAVKVVLEPLGFAAALTIRALLSAT